MNTPSKRFIAGAVCRACQAIDRVVVYRIDDTEFCECVQCGDKQKQETEAKPAIAKLGKKEHVIQIIRPKKLT